MPEPINTDYELSRADVDGLMGATLLPAEVRLLTLQKYHREHGTESLINLFVQFIGLANSVVANNREMIELCLITECKEHPHIAEKVNLPTIHGALNGCVIAVPPTRKMCHGCAFRLGTPANQSPATTCDAKCSLENSVGWDHTDLFMCHEKIDENGDCEKVCVGFAEARRALDRVEWSQFPEARV